MIKGILCDIDGTLIDSNDAHTHAFVEALAEHGFTIPFEKIRPLIGMGGKDLLIKVIPNVENNQQLINSIEKSKKKIFFSRYYDTIQPTKGAKAFIQKCIKDNKKIMIATSAGEDEIHKLLKKAEVDDLVTEFVSSSEVEDAKPAPDIIKQALTKLQLKPNECLMLGDTQYDIEASHRSGVKIVAFLCGGTDVTQLEKADHIFASPEGLIEAYDKVMNE